MSKEAVAAKIDEMMKEERIRVFVPDNEYIWLSAEIISEIEPGKYEIEITDPDYKVKTHKHQVVNERIQVISMNELCIPLDALPLDNEGLTEDGVDDMTSLNYLHEPSILDNLRRRFHKYLPYTYTGEICIAVNPYKWLKIYTDELREEHARHLRHELKPHVYATSAAAYKGLQNFDRNQSILVSGESGAGKTETVKILMGHIAHISGKRNDDSHIEKKALVMRRLLETIILHALFDNITLLAGSKCVTYLLEKSRVIRQNKLERNYHIFHQVLAAPNDIKATIYLDNMTGMNFHYMNQGDLETTSIEGVEDSVRFQQTLEALELLGVGKSLTQEMLRILVGVLYLGEVFYTGDTDSSQLDLSNPDAPTKCVDLLGLQMDQFAHITTNRSVFVRGQDIIVPLSKDQAYDGRDALAKDLYDKLFLWLVDMINKTTSAKFDGKTTNDIDNDGDRIIALLDIFGFETFKVNRFEQLCINFANEKLQQKFTQDVFQAVQSEYKEEGLEWEAIGYKDNEEVLDLLEGRYGVLTLLNEECMIPKGNDMNYLGRLNTACAKHPCFMTGHLLARDEFCVVHFAGKVAYSVTGFLDSNKDTLPPDIRSLMNSSTNSIIAGVYNQSNKTAVNPANRKASPKLRRVESFMKADTVTIKFRSQLDRLMIEIGMTDVQYVRCIKPNSLKSSTVFDRPMIVNQLRCAGMIEAIRISRAAYPYRMTHQDFVNRFAKLRPRALKRAKSARPLTMAEKCGAILRDICPDASGAKTSSGKAYELGVSKVYFSSGLLETLEDLRGKLMMSHIINIQTCYRRHRIRKFFLLMKRSSIKIQTLSRKRFHHRRYRKLRRAMIGLQCYLRMRIAKRKLINQRRLRRIVQIQSFCRMLVRRLKFFKFRKAVRKLGPWIRMIVQKSHYKVMLEHKKEEERLAAQLAALKLRLEEEERERARKEEEQKQRDVETAARLQREEEEARMEREERLRQASEPGRGMGPFEVGTQTPMEWKYSNDSSKNRQEELAALESLQVQLRQLRTRNEQLSVENMSMKKEMRRGSIGADMKLGELAFSKVAVEQLEKELNIVKGDNEKLKRVNNQYKVEKSHVMDTLLQMSNEVDETLRVKEELQKRYTNERRFRLAHLQATLDLLTARGVSSDIIDELQTLYRLSNFNSGEGELSPRSLSVEEEESKKRQSQFRTRGRKGTMNARPKSRKFRVSDRDEDESIISSVSTHREEKLRSPQRTNRAYTAAVPPRRPTTLPTVPVGDSDDEEGDPLTPNTTKRVFGSPNTGLTVTPGSSTRGRLTRSQTLGAGKRGTPDAPKKETSSGLDFFSFKWF